MTTATREFLMGTELGDASKTLLGGLVVLGSRSADQHTWMQLWLCVAVVWWVTKTS